MIGEESVPLEVLSFFVGNNNPKKLKAIIDNLEIAFMPITDAIK